MNLQVQAITDALKTDDGDQIHLVLVQRSQKLRTTLDKITSTVGGREAHYAKIATLRREMETAMDAMADGDETADVRSITKIAADLKRANDSIDKDIDKVYELISEADTLRSEVSDIVQKIAAIPLAATAA